MKNATRNTLLGIIILIGLLLLANIYLIDRNNSIIKENKVLQQETEVVKSGTADIIRNVHFLDMNLRGYALKMFENNGHDIDTAKRVRDRTFASLESTLRNQGYLMINFYTMRDSIISYFGWVDTMKRHIDEGKMDLFLSELRMNRGYGAWYQYHLFAGNVNEFENQISTRAQVRYDRALTNSYFLQVFLFFIIVPTLGYTAFYTFKSMNLSAQLWRSQEDKNQFLVDQKSMLEQKVLERTNEIQSKNKIIEEQSKLILIKNDELSEEVKRQTQHLEVVNEELIEHNRRLQQFTYIISHNLRSPITRLVGLSNIMSLATNADEKSRIMNLIVKSAENLDHIIADLNIILGIQKLNETEYSNVRFDDVLTKATRMLEPELKESGCKLVTDFAEATSIFSFPQYIESVFYNLLSNASKYRAPDRPLLVKVRSWTEGSHVKVSFCDNGLGIDTKTNAQHLFSLYKRFHFHVEGKGVGLFLIKTQLAALGATIHLASEPNEGALFTLSFDSGHAR